MVFNIYSSVPTCSKYADSLPRQRVILVNDHAGQVCLSGVVSEYFVDLALPISRAIFKIPTLGSRPVLKNRVKCPEMLVVLPLLEGK
jgi:hypothetical protein